MPLLDPATVGLAVVGNDVLIYELARITEPDCVRLGSHVVVDDFVFLQGHRQLAIGDYGHVASFASIMGGGECTVGAFTSISSGARILTGTDLADGSGLFGPRVPSELRAVRRARTTIGPHVLVGANAVVLPGVTIGPGAVIGAGAVVTRDIDPWTVNVGAPARSIRRRPSQRVLQIARRLGVEGHQ